MLSNIKISHLVTIAVVILLCGIFTYLKIENSILKNKNATLKNEITSLNISVEQQNQAIMKWKQTAADEQIRLVHSEKKASEAMALANRRADLLKREHVSEKCEEAMQWGIQKAEELSR